MLSFAVCSDITMFLFQSAGNQMNYNCIQYLLTVFVKTIKIKIVFRRELANFEGMLRILKILDGSLSSQHPI